MQNKCNLDYINETKIVLRRFPKLFAKIVQYAFKNVLNIDENVYLSVSIVSKETIHQLNNDYRGVDRPTDVLSFPYSEVDELYRKGNEDETIVLGDIFICYDIALEQSLELEHGVIYEISFLFTHGLLHLCHINHDTDEENAIMERKLNEILTQKGKEDPWEIRN